MARKKKEVAYRKHALIALYEVYDFIAKDSEANAGKFVNEIKIFIRSLADFPEKYPECGELLSKKKIYRSAVFGNYRIIYKISKQIEILDIFHTKRNPIHLKILRRVK
jgi:plasmid stabilization system protein ParE